MNEREKKVLQKYHEDVRRDAEFFTKQWIDLPCDADDKERHNAFETQYRYRQIADKVDSLIKALLITELESNTD